MYIIYNGVRMVIFMDMMQATNVRKNFSSVIDTAVRDRPVMFKRNRDYLMLLSNTQVLSLLREYTFKAQYIAEEDETITAVLDGFDLVVNAADQEQARNMLAVELVDYAKDYFDQFQLYYNSLNRKEHFPYILRVLLAEDLDEVKELINA
jgi:antitoxin YefM